jgi:hypothetical protein
MELHSRQAVFLEQTQQAIGRYQPILERRFGVSLGDVVAKPLAVREFIKSIYWKSDELMLRSSLAKHRGPPTQLRRVLHRFEKVILWLPACILVSLRFWLPNLIMKWSGNPPAILISFMGWSSADYETNADRIAQWAVHEMAHGVWQQLAQDEFEVHDRRWKLWNEGFAHYIADVYMRDAYPTKTKLSEEWSQFRRRGRQLVSDAVARHGIEALRRIPTNWRDFDNATLKSRQATINAGKRPERL